MKIYGKVIRPLNISVNTKNEFKAVYKGKQITINTIEAYGKPEFEHLTRFNIFVRDIKLDKRDYFQYKDFHTIRDAIRLALIVIETLESNKNKSQTL